MSDYHPLAAVICAFIIAAYNVALALGLHLPALAPGWQESVSGALAFAIALFARSPIAVPPVTPTGGSDVRT